MPGKGGDAALSQAIQLMLRVNARAAVKDSGNGPRVDTCVTQV